MSIVEHLISTVAPHTCLTCGREGTVVCAWCRPDFAETVPSRCYICYAATPDSQICERCRPNSRLKHVWIRANYASGAKELVHKLKFQRAKAAAETMAAFMAESLPYLPNNLVLVPVPTASQRMRQRGYDQASLLARELSKILNLPYEHLLRRYGQSRQVGHSRKERLIQLNGAFRTRANLTGQHIVLVDDVLTTGATIETAAKTLKQAGAKQVDAAIFAQTTP